MWQLIHIHNKFFEVKTLKTNNGTRAMKSTMKKKKDSDENWTLLRCMLIIGMQKKKNAGDVCTCKLSCCIHIVVGRSLLFWRCCNCCTSFRPFSPLCYCMTPVCISVVLISFPLLSSQRKKWQNTIVAPLCIVICPSVVVAVALVGREPVQGHYVLLHQK